MTFWSSEYEDSDKRPRLSITFGVPKPAPYIVELENSLCEGESYDFRGTLITESGVYRDTSTTGCIDSIFIMEAVILPTATSELSEMICEGATYIFGEQTLTTSGIYHDTLPAGRRRLSLERTTFVW